MKHAAGTALLSNLKWNINCQQQRVRITFAKISNVISINLIKYN